MPRLRETPEERKKRELEESIAASEARNDYYFRTGDIPPKDKKPNGKVNPETPEKKVVLPNGVALTDFSAYLPMHQYIYQPTRETWPAASVNARVEPVPAIDQDGEPILDSQGRQEMQPASAWLDRNRAVVQMTWAPGEPMLIEGRLVANGGWILKEGVTAFNLYQPPSIKHGDASKARPWLRHVFKIYGKDARHIVQYLAFKVQRPQDKINHALLLGGGQGIGKDTLLEPVKHAVGHWNFEEVTPKQVCGRFNGFVKSVFLRINELRDLGDGSRFDFYEHMKVFTAAPPDTLRVDEKHLREYPVFNVCGVIITTNYKTNGIYLPAEDRRHYVAWSNLKKENFTKEYWDKIWTWYAAGGFGHVAAYLSSLDISDFDPKAAPPKTDAFWAIVNANRSPEDSDLADAIDNLGTEEIIDGEKALVRPKVVTLAKIMMATKDAQAADWIKDHKNRRIIPHRLEESGYVPVRNPAADDGLWKINGKRQAVYAQKDMTPRDQLAAAMEMTGQRSQ